MPEHDLLIHATSADGTAQTMAVADGIVTELAPRVSGTASEEVEAPDCLLAPGWIDSHVHFNEPGRVEWEGLASGSRALAAGGGTAFFDMPLNSSPPVTTRETFEAKKAIAQEKSCLDFALWGGLIPSSLPSLREMAEAGAIGFKAFMCHSGLDEFPAADAETLRAGMKVAAELGLPVAVHAEIPHGAVKQGRTMADWQGSRPTSFETHAIELALELAAETGCLLHVVHVTCPEGIALVTQAKKEGVKVTVETCPHYLLLSTDDALTIGPLAKCAPPLRPQATVEAMWELLSRGEIDTIGSDHSPSSPDLKEGADVFAMWGGVAGIQHGFPLLLDRSEAILPQISENVARRFGLAGKGKLAPGYDADFSLIKRLDEGQPVPASGQLTRHPHSPYSGQLSSHQVLETYLRGKKVTDATRGKFLSPTKNPA